MANSYVRVYGMVWYGGDLSAVKIPHSLVQRLHGLAETPGHAIVTESVAEHLLQRFLDGHSLLGHSLLDITSGGEYTRAVNVHKHARRV